MARNNPGLMLRGLLERQRRDITRRQRRAMEKVVLLRFEQHIRAKLIRRLATLMNEHVRVLEASETTTSTQQDK